jgi:hypothetical protein
MARALGRLLVVAVVLISASAPRADAQAPQTSAASAPAQHIAEAMMAARSAPERAIFQGMQNTAPVPRLHLPDAVERLRSKPAVAFVSRIVTAEVDVPGLGACSVTPKIGGGRVGVVFTHRFNP